MGFITTNHKKTKVIDGKLSESYQVYQAAFQERAHIFQYCGYNIVTTILSLHSFQTLLFTCDQFVETLVSIDSESSQTSFPSFLRAAIWSGSPNHIKFIKLRSSIFFNIVVTHVLSQEDILEIQAFGCDSSPRMSFVRLPLPMRNVPSWSVFHQGRASCTGDLYAHELKTCYAELTNCCCFLHSTYTET